MHVLGFMDFSQPEARAAVAGYDFMITVGAMDDNPTTILESMAWGLIPAVTMQSGYENRAGIVNVPLNDALAAVDPSGTEGRAVWVGYLRDWTLWNHVRTLACTGAMALYILAIAAR